MPNQEQCDSLNPYSDDWNNKCGKLFSDNSYNCIRKELCINRDKGNKLVKMNMNTTAIEKYANDKITYEITLMNTINLGIGIMFLVVIIYKNYK
jgi:hypothetical protein